MVPRLPGKEDGMNPGFCFDSSTLGEGRRNEPWTVFVVVPLSLN